jgi:hypothetical protein
MSWIPIDHATPEKPEVLKLARILGVSTDDVIGKLIRFWIWVDKNSVDGVVDAVDADVDVYMRLHGFAKALENAGWLIIDNENEKITVPNFEERSGKTEKARSLKTQRQARYRAQKRLQLASTERLHVDACVDACVDAVDASTASTIASLPLLREEKRREEQKKQQAATKSTAAAFFENSEQGPTTGNTGWIPIPQSVEILIGRVVDTRRKLGTLIKNEYSLRGYLRDCWRKDNEEVSRWEDECQAGELEIQRREKSAIEEKRVADRKASDIAEGDEVRVRYQSVLREYDSLTIDRRKSVLIEAKRLAGSENGPDTPWIYAPFIDEVMRSVA